MAFSTLFLDSASGGTLGGIKDMVSELSQMLGCDINETAEILNVIAPMISLSGFGENGDLDIDIPLDDTEAFFERLSLMQAMDSLSEQERKLIEYRYFKGKTQCETAKLLCVSQVQISRKEKAVLKKLRERL